MSEMQKISINIFKGTLLTLSLLLLGLPVYAADAIGSISQVKGEVYNVSGDKRTALHLGSDVFLNDVLATGADTRVKIKFIDETEIVLSQNAELLVDEYVYEADGAHNSAHFNFRKGSFYYISGLLAKKNSKAVRLETMFGSIGIRGTKVWGGMLDKECKIYVEDGLITVSNEFGAVDLDHGFGTSIADGESAPTEAKVWSQKTIDWVKGNVAF